MAGVKIYKVKLYNVVTDQYVVSRRMATREGAAKMKGEVVENAGIDIDESRLEPGEQWTPIDFMP
jgi:hypothetical protein